MEADGRANREPLEVLVMRLQVDGCSATGMSELYSRVAPFVRLIVGKYRAFTDADDLQQEAFLSLYPAVAGFETGASKFLTYAEYWIHSRIRRYIQRNDGSMRLSAGRDALVKKYRRFCAVFEAEHGREPEPREVSAALYIDLERVEELKQLARIGQTVSLDAPIAGLNGIDGDTVGDMLPASGSLEEDAIERIQREECKRELWACVDELEPEQAAIIRARYQYSATLEQAGRLNGLTATEARAQHDKGLRRLRRWDYSERLRRFLPECEEIYSAGLRGNGVERFQRTWTSSTERAALRLA